MIKIFFDASVLFSAIYSSTGGSRKLAELVKNHIVAGITSENVIEELKDNLDKLKSRENIDQWIAVNQLIVRKTITSSEVSQYQMYIHRKDLHVVGGALITRCDFLVTLDKKHLDNPQIKKQFETISIVSPNNLLVELAKTI